MGEALIPPVGRLLKYNTKGTYGASKLRGPSIGPQNHPLQPRLEKGRCPRKD